ncbi:hypothetical protein GJAV_G00247990 [Gymnothorax javanicus]|nr:hypothetical protein GJAV_G00247990 [Gymnothorax javanicus]
MELRVFNGQEKELSSPSQKLAQKESLRCLLAHREDLKEGRPLLQAPPPPGKSIWAVKVRDLDNSGTYKSDFLRAAVCFTGTYLKSCLFFMG